MKRLLFAALFCAAITINAATQVFTWEKPIAQANWTTNVSIPKFNPALGYLQSATLTLQRTNFLGVYAENTSPNGGANAAITITLDFGLVGGGVSYADTDVITNSLIGSTIFDGVLDYDGPSGDTELVPSFTEDILDLSESALVGSGSAIFNIVSTARSGGHASGNVDAQTTALAGARLTLVYCYIPGCYHSCTYYPKPCRVHRTCQWRAPQHRGCRR